MTVINVYGPTAVHVATNIEEQEEFFFDVIRSNQPQHAWYVAFFTDKGNRKLPKCLNPLRYRGLVFTNIF